MIRKDNDEFVAECNDCGCEEYSGVEDNFLNFVEYIKDQGWRIRKEGEEWIHLCPDCAGGS